MSADELEKYRQYCIQLGNTSALAEINDFKKFYGNTVEVIGGKKIKKGTKGIVFYVERFHYGYQWWNGWSTRIGFKTDEGQAFFTNENNLQLVQ